MPKDVAESEKTSKFVAVNGLIKISNNTSFCYFKSLGYHC